MKSMVDLSHEFLKPVLHKQAICVDATLGQGKDTDFFLSQNVHKVYGFEIQRDVFESTKERLDDQRTCFYNVGHEHMEEYIYEEVDAIIFNFGYFPQGDHDITTQSSSSVSAVRQFASGWFSGSMARSRSSRRGMHSHRSAVGSVMNPMSTLPSVSQRSTS